MSQCVSQGGLGGQGTEDATFREQQVSQQLQGRAWNGCA